MKIGFRETKLTRLSALEELNYKRDEMLLSKL